MTFFEQHGQQLVWRNHGETLVVEPWGEDSIRVRAALMREVKDERFALLDQAGGGDAEIVIENGKKAFVRNGKITALVEVCCWKERAKVTEPMAGLCHRKPYPRLEMIMGTLACEFRWASSRVQPFQSRNSSWYCPMP